MIWRSLYHCGYNESGKDRKEKISDMLARRIVAMVLLAASCAAVSSVVAQPGRQGPPPGCRAWDADLPPQWAPWAESGIPITAAASPADAARAAIAVSKKYSVTLAPAHTVRMTVETPDIDPPPNAHKGLLSVQVPSDGLYWVGVTAGLWIDIIERGTILESTDHGPGPQCASIAKSVQFMLKAGNATIQLSDNRGSTVDLMLAPHK
jgi:hypothetical protein